MFRAPIVTTSHVEDPSGPPQAMSVSENRATPRAMLIWLAGAATGSHRDL